MRLGLFAGGLRPLLLAVVGVAGCGGAGAVAEPDEPGIPPELGSANIGQGAAHGQGTRELRIGSDARLRLGFGERARIEVLLTDADAGPVAGESVRFALVGRATDVSLDVLDMETDVDGLAVTTLMAGDMAATFEVRVSADGAIDRHVEVSVSDSGYGTLSVSAPYAGTRAVVERAIVVRPSGRCDELARDDGDATMTLVADEALARFLALPAGLPYAVAGFALGATGEVLASACVEDVAMRAEREVELALVFEDMPLVPAAELAFEFALEAQEPSSRLGGALRGAMRSAVRVDADGTLAPNDAEARFLLDALEAVLRSDEAAMQPGVAALLQAITLARQLGAAESSLQTQLVIGDAGALRVVEQLVASTVRSVREPGLRAQVGFTDTDDGFTLRALSTALDARLEDGAGGEVVLELPMTGATSTGRATQAASGDALVVETMHTRVAFGALALAVLTRVASTQDGGQGAALRDLLGCASLGPWLERADIAGRAACDEACLQSVCERALTRLLAAAEPALLRMDDERPALALSFTLALQDEDGDLRADSGTADALSGAWMPVSSELEADAVRGSATATAVVPAM